MTEPLLVVRHLKKYFPTQQGMLQRTTGYVRAVDDVSFDVQAGETFGLVGESGCGKSTTGRTILQFLKPTSGDITFGGRNLAKSNREQTRQLTRDMQIVFQDPYSSLDPRFTVKRILEEPLRIHRTHDSVVDRTKRVAELMEVVGLSPDRMNQYPHEFSGGQRQRIGIARAVAVNPKLIVADEPVSALDVSVQSQILNLFKDLQEKFQLTYVFIAHDLGVVKHISDRVGVMYLGRLVEMAPTDALYDTPFHPYTQALLSAVPQPKPGIKRERIILQGDLPSPSNPPTGCTFHPRCPVAIDKCRVEAPKFREVQLGHFASCHLN